MVFKDELTEALKDRIERDMGFPMVKGWEKVPLGQYYFSSDAKVAEIVVERVVGEVLDNVLSAHGKIMGQDSWIDFFRGIDPSTKPEDAIEKMLDAASTAIHKPHSTPFFLGAAAAMQAAMRAESGAGSQQPGAAMASDRPGKPASAKDGKKGSTNGEANA